MPCPTCLAALEQGARALNEVIVFRPELLAALPSQGLATPEAVAEWLVRTAGRLRAELDAPNPGLPSALPSAREAE